MDNFYLSRLERIFEEPNDKVAWRKVIANNYDDFGAVFKLHENVAQVYDNKYPYAYHLSCVINLAKHYMPSGVSDSQKNMLLLAAAMHDTIEDARMTYNDIQKFIAKVYKDYFNFSDKQVTMCCEIVYALTDEKGRNRNERHSDSYWRLLKETPGAVFIKMCDRLANIKYSQVTGSRMVEVYKKENKEFLQQIKGAPDLPRYIKIYEELSSIFE